MGVSFIFLFRPTVSYATVVSLYHIGLNLIGRFYTFSFTSFSLLSVSKFPLSHEHRISGCLWSLLRPIGSCVEVVSLYHFGKNLSGRFYTYFYLVSLAFCLKFALSQEHCITGCLFVPFTASNWLLCRGCFCISYWVKVA